MRYFLLSLIRPKQRMHLVENFNLFIFIITSITETKHISNIEGTGNSSNIQNLKTQKPEELKSQCK